jgi:hypothetical protein
MTAKKNSLLAKGVLLENYPDPSALLSPENISQVRNFLAEVICDFVVGQLTKICVNLADVILAKT